MKILIIGNGMYISGRGTNGFGTVMPGVLEYIRGGGDVIEVHMVGTNLKRSLAAASKVEELMQQAGVSLKLITYPDNVEKDKTTALCAVDTAVKEQAEEAKTAD